MSERRKMKKKQDDDQTPPLPQQSLGGITSAMDYTHDPHDVDLPATEWQPYQREWFYKALRLDRKFHGFYLIATLACVYFSPEATEVYDYKTAPNGRFLSNSSRLFFSFFCALLALVTFYVDVYYSTPPRIGDRKWHLIVDGFAGHFSYLTVNIIFGQTCYWLLSFVTEFLWIAVVPGLSKDQKVWALPWLAKAVTASYRLSILSAMLGTLLTLLFLKFNWYEPTWRRDTLEMYRARGNKSFEQKILFTHLNQLPVALFDAAVLKQIKGLTENTQLPLVLVLAFCFSYGVVYLGMTHANYRVNKGYYPYPFMDKVLATWSSEITFFLVLSMGMFLLAAFYHYVGVIVAGMN